MEQLKTLIPNHLHRMIGESTAETLTLTSTSLHKFLINLPQFQQVIGDLTDPELALCRKSKEKALDFKKKGNECFLKGSYGKALSFYSQALRHVPMTNDEKDESLAATLYVNRASSMHKMGLLEECIRDCTRAIVLSPEYAKAWFRRGKANGSLENYEVAIRDLEISLSVEGSLSGKKQIKEELNMILSRFSGLNGRTDSKPNEKHMKASYLAEPHGIKLQCVTTPLKGRGMVSSNDLPPASLMHTEEPLTAIVMKPCRETHCHFCFNELPVDVVFCLSCATPVYCSHYCLEQAGGEQFISNQKLLYAMKNLSSDLVSHVMDSTLAICGNHEVTDSNVAHIPEHRHECGGAHWSVVLPTDVVLAGRLVVKYKEKRNSSREVAMENLEFAHNYNQTTPDNKLELHLYAIVMSYCLKQYFRLDFSSISVYCSELVLVLSQIKVNSMAVIRMKSLDGYEEFENLPKLSGFKNDSTCSVEQVQVGKAIYSTGSLFNHSCQPNIHAYFLSRTLFIRSTEFVPAGNPLELSYGPQVGQLGLQERQKLLEEYYSFICNCKGCTEPNLSDIVISAFRCLQPNCLGAVLEMDHNTNVVDVFSSVNCDLLLPQQEEMLRVASMLHKKSTLVPHITPEHCLTCGSYRDLEPLRERSEAAMWDIKRLKDSTNSKDTISLISDSSRSLSILRSVRHPYSKNVAQAEDFIAEAFVRFEEYKHAMLHCKASIEILEKLYGASHIVIGHELIKLASIQLFSGDHNSALCSIARLETIISLYYGPHANIMFPYLEGLRGEAESHAS